MFVGDGAFDEENKRRINLFRAHRINENTVGVLAARLNIFLTRINLDLQKVTTIVLACYLRKYFRNNHKT